MDDGERNKKRKLADQARIRMKKFRLRKKYSVENLSSSNNSDSSSSTDIQPYNEYIHSPEIQPDEQVDEIEVVNIRGMRN